MTEPTTTPAPEAADEAADRASGKRLTAAEWSEIEAHYEYATMKPMEILQKYGISGSGLSKHIKRRAAEGVQLVRGSKKGMMTTKTAAAVSSAAAATTAAAVSSFAAKRKARIERAKETLFQVSQANTKFHLTIIKELDAGTKTPAAAAADLKALRQSDALLKSIRENQWALLDIENDLDEETMPKLIFEDLSDADIAALADEDDDEDDFDIEAFAADEDDDLVEEAPAED